jgi:hypothetical protein
VNIILQPQDIFATVLGLAGAPPPKTAADPLPPGYYHYYERLYLGP